MYNGGCCSVKWIDNASSGSNGVSESKLLVVSLDIRLHDFALNESMALLLLLARNPHGCIWLRDLYPSVSKGVISEVVMPPTMVRLGVMLPSASKRRRYMYHWIGQSLLKRMSIDKPRME